MIDDRTLHLELPLPHEDNSLQFDVNRLREAFSQIDGWLEQVIQAAGAALPADQKAAPNGVAPLDAQGRIPTEFLPEALLGAAKYIGGWDAATNSPTIPAASTENKGNYYIVIVSGSTTIDGESSWTQGDWIISNGATWDKIANSEVFDATAIQSGVFDLARIPSLPISRTTGLQAALDAKQAPLGFTPVQQGGGSGQGTNKIYLGWSGGGLKAQVDNTDYGVLWSTYNFNPASYMPLTGGNFTGNFGIYNTSPTIMFYDTDWGPRQLHSNGGLIGFLTSGGGWGVYSDDGGNLVASGNVGAYSDIKHKDNVRTIEDALELVEALHGVRYIDKRTGAERVGVIAQEVQEVLPEVVGEGADGLHVDYGNIVGPLIEAVKALSAQNRELMERVTVLEGL
ncbi:tail fiber [Pseudomonas phage Dolphis]|nr:tail fiber [Pseudomonas phage Dolphis]